LNGLAEINDLLKIKKSDVKKDENYEGGLNITSVDAIRITYDLIGRGILQNRHIEFIKSKTNIIKTVKPILHFNQYFHLLRWLRKNRQITDKDYEKIEKIISEEPYSGI